MDITQDQFNALVYWSTLALDTETKGPLAQSRATYDMMANYCHAILKGSLGVSIETTRHELTIFNMNSSLGEQTFITTRNRQQIIDAFNKLMNTSYQYTLDEATRPNLLMYFLTVHGTTAGAGLAAIILSGLLAPGLAPVGFAALVGSAIALFPQFMPLPENSDGLAESIMYLWGVTIIAVITIITLINTPALLLGVLVGAGAGAVLCETAAHCGVKFFNLPKHNPVDMPYNGIGVSAT